MFEYQKIFNEYTTSENKPFLLLNKRIVFPEDKTLPIYSKKLITSDTPWTVLSYQIYKNINYWWVLCALNEKNNIYYAREGSVVLYLQPKYLSLIENYLK